MTTLLDEPAQHQVESSGARLRASAAAIRLSFTWFGTRKTLTPQQKAQAADTFGAEGEFLSAGKTSAIGLPASFRACSQSLTDCSSTVRGETSCVPVREPG